MRRVTSRAHRSLLPAAAAILLVLLCTSVPARSQVLTNTSDGTNFVVSVSLGSLTPGTSATPTSQTARFRIRCKCPTGYHLDATALFTSSPSSPDNGGYALSASDIGVGITSITYRPQVLTPRADIILTGFAYDPATLTATNGLTPFLGMASGQARLADLLTSRKILSGPQVANSEALNNNDYMEVTLTFAVLPQYFTPANFTANVILSLQAGP